MVRILVVEDDADCRGLIKHRLERGGHTVQEAATGEGALRFLSKSEYDLVILDIYLPGISGWEVAHRIAADPETSHLPVLFLSVSERDEAPQDVRSKGWLSKPFTNQDLKQAVEKMTSRREDDQCF